jgi:acetyltransferase-like isoleucine patch superfamily enzyme
MKAFIVAATKALPPFQKPVSKVRFKEGTLRERLEAQLKDAGCEVVAVDAAPAPVPARSIVVSDDVVLSEKMLRRFLAAIPDKAKSYELEVESARFTMLASQSAPAQWKRVPLAYHGDGAAVPEALRIQPRSVFDVVEGLPPRMHLLTDIAVYFFDVWAVKVDYWFDLQTATSLYSRELVTRMIGPFRGRVPNAILDRFTSSPFVMGKFNSIGKRCRIHRTAILEGCTIGDDVEIGPFAYCRSSVIGDRSVLREKSAVKMSYLGPRTFVMGSDIVNSYVGAETSIFTPMLYNVVFGERGFLSGGSGFADFIVGASSIPAIIEGKQVQSGLPFLASGIGDDVFIGANMIFAPGRTIPDGTQLLDHGLIKQVPTRPNGAYVLSGDDFVQIPDSFLKRRMA